MLEALYAYNAIYPSSTDDEDDDHAAAAEAMCVRVRARVVPPSSSPPRSDDRIVDPAGLNRSTRMGYVEWTTRHWQWMTPPAPDHVSITYTTEPYVPTPAHIACMPWHFEKDGVMHALVDAQLATVCALAFAPNRSVRLSVAATAVRRELVAARWSTGGGARSRRPPERRARTVLMPNGTGKTIVGLMWGTVCAMADLDDLHDVCNWLAGENGAQSVLDPALHAVVPIFVYACTAMVMDQVLEEAHGCARAWRAERKARVDVLPRDAETIIAYARIGRSARAAAALGGCVVVVVTHGELDGALQGIRRQLDADGKHMLPLALYIDDDDGRVTDGDGVIPRVLYGGSAAARRPRWPVFEAKEDSRALLQQCAEFASQDVASHFIAPLIDDLGALSTRGLVRFEIVAAASNPLIRALDHPDKDPTFKLSITDLYEALRLKGSVDNGCTRVGAFVETVHEALEQGARTARAMTYLERRRLTLLQTLVDRLCGETAIACPICYGEMAPDAQLSQLFITPCCTGLICAPCRAACIAANPHCPRCRRSWDGIEVAYCDQVVAHAHATPIMPSYAPTATTFDELVRYVQRTDLSALADHPMVVCALLDEVCAAGITLVIIAWHHGPDSAMGRALGASGHAVHYMAAADDAAVLRKKRAREDRASTNAVHAARRDSARRTRGSLMVLVTTPARVQCVDLPYARVLVHTGCHAERDEVGLVGRMLRPQPRNAHVDDDGKLVIKLVT